MRTKIVKVLDDYTEIFYLITQFEEIDIGLCKRIGVNPGFKIVNQLKGKYVGTFSGYSFIPDTYQDIKYQTHSLDIHGTINAFGILLTATDDIKYIPNEVDVSNIQHFYLRIGYQRSFFDNIFEVIVDCDRSSLRKYLFKSLRNIHLSIYDIENNELIYDTSSSCGKEYILAKYLWVPIKEISKEELSKIEISPFMYNLIKPEI